MILTQRFFIIGVMGLVFAMAVQPSSSRAEVSGKKAEAFISGLADQAIKAITVPNISKLE